MLSFAAKSSPIRPGAAYTLLEVLIAIGIFAIGFAMVAAIFPAAILLQKQTRDDVQTQQVSRASKAVLEARGVSEGELTANLSGTWDTSGELQPFPAAMLTATPGVTAWAWQERGFPTMEPTAENRRYFWVPMVRDDDMDPGVHRWRFYALVLHRERGLLYPKSAPITWANPDDPDEVPGVAKMDLPAGAYDSSHFYFQNEVNAGDVEPMLRPGDQIIDSNGVPYSIVDADTRMIQVDGVISTNPTAPNAIWYGRPSATGKRSPLKRIMIVDPEVLP